ncbi:hypothetical protein IGI04_020183 [Brassica rapa subsp. trilocularis]|uniref:Uncharacterized protein n=1 Tax=Brassica rapa subsp. trilocularis TaxID=1813537 RepID=A0ABQ7MLE3_BRACM|nr:hypothetical protein IGI04_020183 [Brassica rapa subsp. trilocularis]
MIGDSFAERYRRSDSGGFFKAMVAIFRILDPPVRVERNGGGRRKLLWVGVPRKVGEGIAVYKVPIAVKRLSSKEEPSFFSEAGVSKEW